MPAFDQGIRRPSRSFPSTRARLGISTRQMPPNGNESRKNHLCIRGSVPCRCTTPGLGYLIDSREHTMVVHGPGRRLIPTTALATGTGMKRRLTCLFILPPMKHSNSGKIPFDPLKDIHTLRSGSPASEAGLDGRFRFNDLKQALPSRNGPFTCGGQPSAFPRQGLAWGRESCWRQDS
jgi:hypothetical protein